jgi:hypothetical protein
MWIDVRPDKRVIAMIGLSLFWSFLSGISTWLLLNYRCANLAFRNGGVILKGVIRRKKCDLEIITAARWEFPRRRITLRTPQEKLTIDLMDFEPEKRLWLIRYFRRRLPDSVQKGWDLFCHKVALPLRDDERQGNQPPGPEQVVLTRRRWDWYFVPLIVLSVVIGVVGGLKLEQPRMLIAPVMPIGLWLFLRFSTPKRGLASRRLGNEPARRFLVFLGMWSGVGVAGCAVVMAVGEWMQHLQSVATIGFLVLWVAGLLWQGNVLGREARERDREAAKIAVKRWSEDEGESCQPVV